VYDARATVLAIVLVSTSSLGLTQDVTVLSGHSEDQQDTSVSGALRNESPRTERTATPTVNKSPADGQISSGAQAATSGEATTTSSPSQTQQLGKPSAGATQRPASRSKHGAGETSAVPLNTVSSAISTVITSSELRNLPLFNRNFLTVGLLVPGTSNVPAWSELRDTTFSISGQRPTSNAFLLDGMDNEASSNNQAIPFQVNDAVQEFRVTTATSDAQFGRNMGGVVNIITRRGTAQFHGSVFGFFASSDINASSPLSVYGGSGFSQAAAFAGPLNAPAVRSTSPYGSPLYEPNSYNQYVSTVHLLNTTYGTNFCTAPNATPGSPDCLQRFDPAAVLAQHNSHTQPLSSQQFGAQAGGSFLKRWYWFGDYEGTRINNPNPIFERVPSSYDRSHLSQFAPGTAGYQDAVLAQAVLGLYPQSNVQAIPDVLEFYQGYAPNYTNVDNYLGRIDFTQSDRTEWTFRYNLQNLSQLHDDTLPSSPAYPGNGAQRAVFNQNLVLTFTHRFSDEVSNVLRGGFTRFQVKETPQDANFDASSIGLPPGPMQTWLLSGLDPQYAGATCFISCQSGAWGGWYDAFWVRPSATPEPVIAPSLDGLFPFARIGAPFSAPGERRDTELELADNVVWFKGRHTIRTGFYLGRIQNIFDNGGFSRGMVVSDDLGEFTSASETPVSTPPSDLRPSFNYAMKEASPYDTTLHSYIVAGYLQDMWRTSPRLTINLGLRYEYFSPSSEVNHQLWNYDPTANGLVQQDTTQVTNTFGVACLRHGSTMYSIYPDHSYTLPWDCRRSGNGNFVVASTTNFEPRIGVAWSTAGGDTVVRAGFGIFYDEVPASLVAQLAFNRPVPLSLPTPQTIYGQNFHDSANSNSCRQCGLGNSSLFGMPYSMVAADRRSASVPFGLSAVDPANLNNPLNRQVSFSVARQISRNASAELDYIGNFMANLPTITNTGFNNEWFCTASAHVNPNQPCDAFSYVPVFTHANIGYGNYNAFVAKVTTRSWHGLQGHAWYAYSKALDNSSSADTPLIPGPLMTQTETLELHGTGNPLTHSLGDGVARQTPPCYLSFCPPLPPPSSVAASFAALTGLLTAGIKTTGAGQVVVTPYTIPQDPYNFLRNDYGASDYNQSNRFILEYSWEVPASKPSQLRSGWMLSGVFIAQSGQPFTIFSGPIAGELNQRVSLTGPLTITGNPNGYLGNTAAIVLPGTACADTAPSYSPYVTQPTLGIRSGVVGTPCLGNSARNEFTGPGYVDYDMAIQKTFTVRERVALSLRAESFNLFNHPNYYNPISTYSVDGVTSFSQFGQIRSAHNAREFQFAARMSW
jgi:hypothetical protein